MPQNNEHVTTVCVAKTQVSQTEHQTEMNWYLKYKVSCESAESDEQLFVVIMKNKQHLYFAVLCPQREHAALYKPRPEFTTFNYLLEHLQL